MTTQTEIALRHHRRSVRFFWAFLICATTVSLVGNIAHAAFPYLPRMVIQIGAAAVPPIVLLAAVHGIALAVRAGASGRVYRWAVSAVAVIGVGAFTMSFLALRDLMQAIGYSSATAWIFPAIIDTAVAVSTVMLVALGDKPARRARVTTASASTQIPTTQQSAQPPTQGGRAELKAFAPGASTQMMPASRARSSALAHTVPAQREQDGAQTVTPLDAELASELIASGVTTQRLDTVIEVLAASRSGASINAAAKATGINYRTAQRIVEAAAERRRRQVAAVG
jgi:hypothetical protein